MNRSFLAVALTNIYQNCLQRLGQVLSRFETPWVACLSLLPTANAASDVTSSNSQSNNTLTASDVYSMTHLFDFAAWRARGTQIRSGRNRAECFANLSTVLGSVGPLYSSETNGASGALSLLPTAGALIGAPAKELWVLYKLMPVAGVLSMVLSLGGNIVPMQSSDYEVKSNAFAYGGMIATSQEAEKAYAKQLKDASSPAEPDAQMFADQVLQRSQKHLGSTKRITVAVGIFLQLFWIAILLAACWITQAGGVVAWWCKVSMSNFLDAAVERNAFG